jgi:hypothetical protein
MNTADDAPTTIEIQGEVIDVAAWVARSRAAQGLPRHIEDEAAIDAFLDAIAPTGGRSR